LFRSCFLDLRSDFRRLAFCAVFVIHDVRATEPPPAANLFLRGVSRGLAGVLQAQHRSRGLAELVVLSRQRQDGTDYVVEQEVLPKNHMISKSACKAPICFNV
jgi:hypothetical protein